MKRALSWRNKHYYDRHEFRRVVHFFETEMFHIEGELAGQPFKLLQWERRLLRRVFAWKKKKDKTRKHRVVLLFVPRGQGKSIIVAGCGNYLFAADKEKGSQVIAAAADSEQAEIIFKYAKGSVLKSKKLSRLVGKPYRRSMAILTTGSSFKVISSTAETKHGMNLHGVLVDELHAQPNRELTDVLLTSTRTRMQPLVFYATTAGFNKDTVCGEIYDYAVQVRDGLIDDDEFLPVIFEANKDDDWTKVETWKKANPSYDISVRHDYLESQCKKAQKMPSYENTFRRLHLNQWTEQETRWIPIHKWKECAKEFKYKHLFTNNILNFFESDLVDFPCIGGLDLSDRLDITAFSLLFKISESDYYVLPEFWVPKDTALDRQRKGQGNYFDWINRGFMFSTDGNDIDYNFIEKRIETLSKKYKIKGVAYDPWNANQLVHNLKDKHGIDVIPVRQGYASMSSPSKDLEALIVSEKIHHNNNPVMNYMMSNVCIAKDPAGNIKPVKNANKNQKIDGVVTIVMALSRMIGMENLSSVYHERGVLSF